MEKPIANNQFVIQEHRIASEVHWDLMLEHGGKLWTWRLDVSPLEINDTAAAERIFDHPLKFLSYEGPVQNGTGHVTITDKGDLRFNQIEAGTISVVLHGEVLKGLFTLQLENAPMWVLTKADR